MANNIKFTILREEAPDFMDLPWEFPLTHWQGRCLRLEDVPRGISRHPVVFVNYSGKLYAIKSLPQAAAKKEFELLTVMEKLRLPAVIPVGVAENTVGVDTFGILITQYLEQSLPYRNLFMNDSLAKYRENLLDAMAGLLVQLHLNGVYWGDCSLSNTLFRRDAGALQAYLVDIETGEYFADKFPATKRLYDLEIMEENVNGELHDLGTFGLLAENVPLRDTGSYIRLRYQSLWEEITHEDIIDPGETYLIHERIRALNDLGFSVGDVDLVRTESGDQLRLRIQVTDRNFHRDQFYNLTAIDAEEKQAQQLMNEIQEIKASLSRMNNQSIPLSVAAYHWLENIYKPVVAELSPLCDESTSLVELYCQVLEHKWYLSEKAGHDVGHNAAAKDFINRFTRKDLQLEIK